MTSQAQTARKRRRSLVSRLYTWLTSMNLAIALLSILAIASVIGTVLKQNQPFNDYLIEFGPYWFEVFKALKLYDVYSASWFVAILLFLLASTSACLIRNTPGFLRDIKSFRLNAQEKSLKAFAHSRQFETPMGGDEVANRARGLLQHLGYKARIKQRDGETLVAARKGGMNRIGYVLTHLGMVVILVGGLVDSKMYLKTLNMLGVVEVETRDLPVSKVPEESHLPPGSLAGFRGSVNIPEGKWGDVAFIGLKDGYVVQNLPFKIEVEDFFVEFYDTGMPKSFNSKLTLTDKETGESTSETIRVNHPLRYQGYNIFQSSFGDGGTELTFDAWQLAGDIGTRQEREGKVNDDTTFQFNDQKYTLEFRDFSLFNVNPTKGPDGKTENTNFGPSVTFRLRDASGQAVEYENYFQPVDFDGTKYFLSGVTKEVGGQQQFLFIPADRDNSLETFMAFYARLKDQEAVANIAADLIGQTTQGEEQGDSQMQSAAARSIADLVKTFVNDGFSALGERVDQSLAERGLEGEQAEQARNASFRVVQSVLMRTYMEVLDEQGVKDFTEEDAAFFEDALDVITVIPNYGSPIYLAPKTFNHIQSTGLEITRAPGMFWVYLGSLMLVAGIFMLFYIHYRRLWVLIKPTSLDQDDQPGGHRVVVAGTDARKNIDFDQAFAQFSDELQRQTGSNVANHMSSSPEKG
ncbi:cytochrome c biogenesis protein ResB [Guyparkeria hydrothermalis]|uniref:cytochrome c biogenesis protein ResB n=1 Tax=Guyparkeria hydrothermalis TaxID=923 RepID=UPI0020223F43|nr:cytochrome c biogenesis protein ResB [Guyparkeria hydrothermalis]MCL7745021.1 cytochrome c biogenesis protein ResB [Guyparkeria hydrothermalis]